MKNKDNDLIDVPNDQDKVQPLEISIKPKELEVQFNNILAEAADFELVLPSGVLVPALVPDSPGEIPGAEPEPVYGPKARGNIQGNIIPGFNKDHQHFLFYRLGNIKRANAHSDFAPASGGSGISPMRYSTPGYSRNGRGR